MNWARLAFIATLMLPALSQAAPSVDVTPPPAGAGIDVVNWSPTLHSPPSTGVTLGALRIRFEQTTVQGVLNTIGIGRIASQGDAAEAMTWLCYTVPDGTHSSRIWLTSGEIEGRRYINGISIRAIPEAPSNAPGCPLLPARFRPVTLDHSIRISMPDRVLLRTLGRPSHEGRGWQMFDYAKPMRHAQCELDSSVWARAANGHVTAIDANQITSC